MLSLPSPHIGHFIFLVIGPNGNCSVLLTLSNNQVFISLTFLYIVFYLFFPFCESIFYFIYLYSLLFLLLLKGLIPMSTILGRACQLCPLP